MIRAPRAPNVPLSLLFNGTCGSRGGCGAVWPTYQQGVGNWKCVCVWGGGGYVLVCVDGMLCACMHACVSATIQPTNLRDNRPNEVDMCQLLT